MLSTSDKPMHPRMLRAQSIVKRTKEGLRVSMGGSASSEVSEEAEAGLHACMDELVAALNKLVGTGLEAELHAELSELLMGELAPYLGRIPLVGAFSSPEDGRVVTTKLHDALAIPLDGNSSVDHLDGWLRAQPSMNALVAIPDACLKATGRMADRAVDGPIWVLGADHPRVALGLESAGGKRPIVRIDWTPPQRLPEAGEAPALIVLPGLLEALPDRHAIRLLSGLRTALCPGGRLVASALVPSPDAAFVDLVLGWPTHRRKPAQLLDLFILAGLAIVADVPAPEPGLVVVAQDKSDAMSSSSEV
jgi:hypothetical protein